MVRRTLTLTLSYHAVMNLEKYDEAVEVLNIVFFSEMN